MYCNFGSKAVRVCFDIQLQRCMVIYKNKPEIETTEKRRFDQSTSYSKQDYSSYQYLDLTRSLLLLLMQNQLNCLHYRLKCAARDFLFSIWRLRDFLVLFVELRRIVRTGNVIKSAERRRFLIGRSGISGMLQNNTTVAFKLDGQEEISYRY